MTFIAGCLLGAFFFGGLWWTVQKMAETKNPYLLTMVSFVLRMAVVMGGFYLILNLDWRYMVSALAGFIIVRFYLTYKLKPANG